MRTVSSSPQEIGGDTATTDLPPLYEGACKVVGTQPGIIICVLPNLRQAEAAARYAITPDGGYGSVEILGAPDSEITHLNWQDWAF